MDKNVKFSSKVKNFVHGIDPDLDAENHYIMADLKKVNSSFVDLAQPQRGMINTGDKFIWSGKALIMDLTNED